jgi:tRNA (cmo5U34)-methyltransferase
MNEDTETQEDVVWDPDTYPEMIRSEVHSYDELQDRVAQATHGIKASSILDLGIGAGETSGRVLKLHPGASLVGVDSSREMLAAAARSLPNATFVEQDLSAPLPGGPYDLVVSTLAIHHLEGRQKAELFERAYDALSQQGAFVMGDVVVPGDPAHAVIENTPGYDFPSPIPELLEWLSAAGFEAQITWQDRDLAVFKCTKKVA